MDKCRQFLTELSARNMSVFSYLDDNFSKYQWIFTRLGICIALILWRSAFRLLMAKSSIFGLSGRNTSVFYFLDNNFSKSRWIFTKFDMCIDIVEICLGNCSWTNFVNFYRVICPRHDNGGVLSFPVLFYAVKQRFKPRTNIAFRFVVSSLRLHCLHKSTTIVTGHDTLEWFSVILYNEDNICNFLLTFLGTYSRLSLSRSPRDSLKYLEISVLRHIRFADFGKKVNGTTRFHKWICNLTFECRNILKILWKRGEIAHFSSFPQYYVTCR